MSLKKVVDSVALIYGCLTAHGIVDLEPAVMEHGGVSPISHQIMGRVRCGT